MVIFLTYKLTIMIIVWIIMCALIALLGKERKIGYGWSFAACAFLSPIIGLIIILCSKKTDDLQTEENMESNTANSSVSQPTIEE